MEAYISIQRQLVGLERWLQFGDRSLCVPTADQDLLCIQDDDDIPDIIKTLRQRCNLVREHLWNLTPEPPEDSHLFMSKSWVRGAGMGLFAAAAQGAGVTVCYYVGWEHSLQSAMAVQDRAYMLRLGPRKCSNANYDEISSGCVYVDARHMTSVKARFLNDCANENGYNVMFFPEPDLLRARVVSLRPINQGEELFVSYGESYWQACGITPKSLSDAELEIARSGCQGPLHSDQESTLGDDVSQCAAMPVVHHDVSDLDPVWGLLSGSF